MKLLEQVHRGRRRLPRRVSLYGVQGVGKSTWGAQADDPIFIPTEDGLDDIDCAKFPKITTFEQAIGALSELYSEQHDYRTVVVDALDSLEQLIWTEVCRKHCVSNIEKIGYGKGYIYAIDLWRDFLDGLNALRLDRGMMIILIAHAKIEKFQDPEADSYDRYMMRLHKFAAALVQEWSDEVLFATYKVYTKSTEEGFGRTVTRGVGTAGRILRTTERPAASAKNRLGLPDELPFTWADYAKYLNQGSD